MRSYLGVPPSSLIGLFLLALAARLAAFGIQAHQTGDWSKLPFEDEQWYWRMAMSIHDGQGLVGEFGHRVPRMPLYPAWLSLFAGLSHGVVWAKLAQGVIGATTPVWVCLLSRRLAGLGTGLVAGCIVALDPLLAGMSSLLLTETLFVTLLAAWWWASRALFDATVGTHVGYALAGNAVLAIAAVYTRPSSLLLVFAVAVYGLVVRRFDRKGIMIALVLPSAVLLSLVPWGWRNHQLTGHFTLFDHRAGISLYDGVGPQATGASNLGPVKDMPTVRDLNEAEWDSYFRREGYRAIQEDPGRIIRLAFVKMQRMWSPVLNAAEYQSPLLRLISAAWTLPFYALVLIGLWTWRRRLEAALWLLLPAIALSLIHSLYIGSVRYRLGAIPSLAILAAVGITTVLGAVSQAKKRRVH